MLIQNIWEKTAFIFKPKVTTRFRSTIPYLYIKLVYLKYCFMFYAAGQLQDWGNLWKGFGLKQTINLNMQVLICRNWGPVW